MLFTKDEDLQLQPKRTKTLLISIGIHVLLLVFFAGLITLGAASVVGTDVRRLEEDAGAAGG